ncbi:opioid-binding protein/cell adhesion molecule homolog [Chrysoperla carnea]|uniref:opioid-binding protein/cell adhesion molecule homolog n=1 Tax=Chrysoperla carnea TaxID=189513 RepID=UPI001D099660|nr:opioid-binding protein/cell adhesion molecule homolog [Chrysoperla carnea]
MSTHIDVCAPQTKFKSIPTTVKTRENDTVLLPCYVDQRETIRSIDWYKDDILIASSSLIGLTSPERFRMWQNGSLEVSDLRNSDTGEYECRVTRNDPATSMAQLHAIEVMYPPSVTSQPESGELTVNLGDEVDIVCKGDGVPYPVIKWYSNETEIRLLDNRPRLRFNVTTKNLAGLYECHAVNGVGEPAVAQFHLTVTYPPELYTPKSWLHTSVGLRAELECYVDANPPAKVSWFKNDLPVRSDSRIVPLVNRDKYSLVIRQMHSNDFGNYTCRATNDFGEVELPIQLSGTPNPAVFKEIELFYDDDTANETRNTNEYTIIWEVDSYSPVFEYKLWFRPYQKHNTATTPEWKTIVIPAERSTGPLHSKSFTITGLNEKTIYEAVLSSRNRYGWSKASPIFIFATEGADMNNDVKIELETRIEHNIIPEEAATISVNLINSGLRNNLRKKDKYWS